VKSSAIQFASAITEYMVILGLSGLLLCIIVYTVAYKRAMRELNSLLEASARLESMMKPTPEGTEFVQRSDYNVVRLPETLEGASASSPPKIGSVPLKTSAYWIAFREDSVDEDGDPLDAVEPYVIGNAFSLLVAKPGGNLKSTHYLITPHHVMEAVVALRKDGHTIFLRGPNGSVEWDDANDPHYTGRHVLSSYSFPQADLCMMELTLGVKSVLGTNSMKASLDTVGGGRNTLIHSKYALSGADSGEVGFCRAIGKIVDTTALHLFHTCYTVAGCSGSPIIHNAKVVAVHVAYDETKRINRAVKIEPILRHLRRYLDAKHAVETKRPEVKETPARQKDAYLHEEAYEHASTNKKEFRHLLKAWASGEEPELSEQVLRSTRNEYTFGIVSQLVNDPNYTNQDIDDAIDELLDSDDEGGYYNDDYENAEPGGVNTKQQIADFRLRAQVAPQQKTTTGTTSQTDALGESSVISLSPRSSSSSDALSPSSQTLKRRVSVTDTAEESPVEEPPSERVKPRKSSNSDGSTVKEARSRARTQKTFLPNAVTTQTLQLTQKQLQSVLRDSSVAAQNPKLHRRIMPAPQ
jgi:hypothetical protein